MVNSVQGPNTTPPLPGASPAPNSNKPAQAGAPGVKAPPGAKTATDAAGEAAGGANTQDRFLKLLVTQMKNQDPLNPMDNAQVTSQMAQLSTVSGIDKINSTLKALTDSMSAGQALSATGMIGHGALVPGSAMELREGKAIAGVELPQGADSLRVEIKDGADNVVQTMQLSNQKPGVVQLAWDGLNDKGEKVPDGSYKISATAVMGGEAAAAKTLSFGMVAGVTPGSGGAKLDVGKLGAFNMADVKQVM